MSCGWPFHHDPECEECKQWERKYGENLTAWLDQKREIREAAKRGRQRSAPTSTAEQDAPPRTTPPMPSV